MSHCLPNSLKRPCPSLDEDIPLQKKGRIGDHDYAWNNTSGVKSNKRKLDAEEVEEEDVEDNLRSPKRQHLLPPAPVGRFRPTPARKTPSADQSGPDPFTGLSIPVLPDVPATTATADPVIVAPVPALSVSQDADTDTDTDTDIDTDTDTKTWAHFNSFDEDSDSDDEDSDDDQVNNKDGVDDKDEAGYEGDEEDEDEDELALKQLELRQLEMSMMLELEPEEEEEQEQEQQQEPQVPKKEEPRPRYAAKDGYYVDKFRDRPALSPLAPNYQRPPAVPLTQDQIEQKNKQKANIQATKVDRFARIIPAYLAACETILDRKFGDKEEIPYKWVPPTFPPLHHTPKTVDISCQFKEWQKNGLPPHLRRHTAPSCPTPSPYDTPTPLEPNVYLYANMDSPRPLHPNPHSAFTPSDSNPNPAEPAPAQQEEEHSASLTAPAPVQFPYQNRRLTTPPLESSQAVYQGRLMEHDSNKEMDVGQDTTNNTPQHQWPWLHWSHTTTSPFPPPRPPTPALPPNCVSKESSLSAMLNHSWK